MQESYRMTVAHTRADHACLTVRYWWIYWPPISVDRNGIDLFQHRCSKFGSAGLPVQLRRRALSRKVVTPRIQTLEQKRLCNIAFNDRREFELWSSIRKIWIIWIRRHWTKSFLPLCGIGFEYFFFTQTSCQLFITVMMICWTGWIDSRKKSDPNLWKLCSRSTGNADRQKSWLANCSFLISWWFCSQYWAGTRMNELKMGKRNKRIVIVRR